MTRRSSSRSPAPKRWFGRDPRGRHDRAHNRLGSIGRRRQAQFDELGTEHRKQLWSLAGLEKLEELFKPEPAWPERGTSVVAAVRPVGGEGTPFAMNVSSFTVPAGASFFFFGSFVGFTVGAVLPLTGDQDLLLHLFTPTGPVVSSSLAFGTALDVVWFTFPFPFVPVFQVRGFVTGVCSNFSANGV